MSKRKYQAFGRQELEGPVAAALARIETPKAECGNCKYYNDDIVWCCLNNTDTEEYSYCDNYERE